MKTKPWPAEFGWGRPVYIASFAFLGFLLASIIHAGIEIPMINLLVSDFDRWSLGLSWEQWFWIHHVGAVLLWVAGILFGYWQGTQLSRKVPSS